MSARPLPVMAEVSQGDGASPDGDRAFAAAPSSPTVSPVPASIPSAVQLRELWAKTEGKAWEPRDSRHPFIGMLVDGGWVKYCSMRCGFEAFNTGVIWTDAARAYFAAQGIEATPDSHLQSQASS